MAEPNNDIKISKFSFWVITTVGVTLITGIAAWMISMNSSVNQTKIDVALAVAKIDNLNEKIATAIRTIGDVQDIKAQFKILESRVERNSQEIEVNKQNKFNMVDYDRYVKPVQDSLIDRISKIEKATN